MDEEFRVLVLGEQLKKGLEGFYPFFLKTQYAFSGSTEAQVEKNTIKIRKMLLWDSLG